ncbi:AMP-binding protein [Variovorax humicola]|uniref:AMP-binding protein n=1 Tax=Variovorax humicola TaxID=1769758 RepID=A0ABU8VTT3_9BURK
MPIPEFDLGELPPLQDRHIGSVFERALARHPDKLAVHDTREGLSYRELHDSALQIAGGLSRLNVGRQETVLMMLDNHVDFVRCWMATALTARIEVPVNTAYVGASLSHAINTSGAKAMIVEAQYVERVLAIRGELEELRTLVVRGSSDTVRASRMSVMNFDELRRGAPDVPAEHKASDAIAILYTSGTSGPSKGSINSQAHAYTYAHPSMFGAATEEDVALIVLPLFHMGGQWAGVYNALVAGATAVIVPRFSASTFWETAAHYKASYCFLLGSMVHFLLGQPPGPKDRLHGLRKMLLVPVPQELPHFQERFGIEQVAAAYGSTEAAVVSRAPVGFAEPGKAGWVREEVQAVVVDPEGLPVPQGEVGELWVRPMEPWTMMNGYIAMPEATVAAWQNFWFHTGDAARFAEDGQIVFVDRIKDAIRRRGENISSFEVEQAIGEHPEVEECAVVAVPSEYVEDEVKACVVVRPGALLDPQQLVAFLSTRLPRFCLPRYVEFMPALPKTATAKVKKAELRHQGVTANTWDGQHAQRDPQQEKATSE